MSGLVDPRSDPSRGVKRVDLRLVAVMGVSFLVVAVVVGVFVAHALRDECSDWVEQLDRVDGGVTKVVRLRGDAREAGLDDLERMQVPCGKVASVRDLCVVGYRHLARAQAEHDQAESLMPAVQRALDALNPALRKAARRCILRDQPEDGGARELGISNEERARLGAAIARLRPDQRDIIERCLFGDQRVKVIASELGIDADEACLRMDIAMNQLGLGNIVASHREVESLLESSYRSLAEAEAANQRCDDAYKRLLAERER